MVAKKFKAVVFAFLLAVTSLNLIAKSSAETVEPKDWWRNCALWQLTDNCVESIEYFNDATGQWEPTIAEKNPDWVPNWVLTEEYRQTRNKIDPVVGKCGHWESIGTADCYLAKGAGIKGEDLLLRTVVYGQSEEVKMNFVTFNGSNFYIRPGVGDQLHLLKPDTKWRMTIVSELFANDAGIARAQMKEPAFAVFKGSDGKSRIKAEGRVQSIYTIEPNKPGDPGCNDVINSKNEYTANRYEVAFSINISRYKYEYEKLKGSPPAGVFITENGGCFSRLDFDTERRMISVAVGAPHFDFDGKVLEGWVQASIRGDVIRKAFNAEPKTMNEALIEVTYADGSSKNATATTKYLGATDMVEIRAYGFTFSAPTINMKLRPIEDLRKAETAPAPTPKATNTAKKVVKIICVKGAQRKSISAVSPAKPSCPKGWKVSK
jgi:hypothetical protein